MANYGNAMATASVQRSMLLGKYRVVEHVAVGGMATVYKAVHEDTGQVVALKVLPPELAVRANSRERFRQEALMGGRLRHDNIVAIYEFDETQGTCYLAMEFVDGPTLADYIARHGPLSPRKTHTVVAQIASALDYACQLGVVHRDVKPANILLTRIEGKVIAKLGDLGLSRELRDEEFRLTREGHTVGTVDYMSPEQARDSRAADIRSDLYSLGCTMHHMLTGQPPFTEGTLVERLMAHAERPPPDPRALQPETPPELAAICMRLLAKKPDQRYQTPAELLAALEGQETLPPNDAGATLVIRRPAAIDADAGAPPDAAADAAAEAAAPLASPAAAAAPAPATSQPPSPSSELPVLDLPADPSPAPPEQLRVAGGQFEMAKKYLKAREFHSGLKYLRISCRLDPTNIEYRQALRDLARGNIRWPWYKALYFRARYHAALWARRPRPILEYGEHVLMQRPDDLHMHLCLAHAAERLGWPRLAWWLLQQALVVDEWNPRLLRALALFLERQRQGPAAIRFWEQLERRDPENREAVMHIQAIAAQETIARGNLQARIGELSAHLDEME
jgi:serine/threonine protein kinase